MQCTVSVTQIQEWLHGLAIKEHGTAETTSMQGRVTLRVNPSAGAGQVQLVRPNNRKPTSGAVAALGSEQSVECGLHYLSGTDQGGCGRLRKRVVRQVKAGQPEFELPARNAANAGVRDSVESHGQHHVVLRLRDGLKHKPSTGIAKTAVREIEPLEARQRADNPGQVLEPGGTDGVSGQRQPLEPRERRCGERLEPWAPELGRRQHKSMDTRSDAPCRNIAASPWSWRSRCETSRCSNDGAQRMTLDSTAPTPGVIRSL